MIFFKPAYAGEKNRLRNAVTVGIVDNNGSKGGKRLIKPIVIEMVFAQAEQETGDQFFWTQETDRPVMFLAIRPQGDQNRGPFDVKIRGQGLDIKGDLERDKIVMQKSNDLAVRVRDRTHLLTADSVGVMKKEQNQSVFRRGETQRPVPFPFPRDLFSHCLHLIVFVLAEGALFSGNNVLSLNGEGKYFLTPRTANK